MITPKFKCKIFGHKWKFNFYTNPSKCICSRCKTKARFDYNQLEWNKVESFIGESRTDEELCNDWVN